MQYFQASVLITRKLKRFSLFLWHEPETFIEQWKKCKESISFFLCNYDCNGEKSCNRLKGKWFLYKKEMPVITEFWYSNLVVKIKWNFENMRLYLHQYITIVTMIIVILSPKDFEGKRNRHRHGRDEHEEGKQLLDMVYYFGRM